MSIGKQQAFVCVFDGERLGNYIVFEENAWLFLINQDLTVHAVRVGSAFFSQPEHALDKVKSYVIIMF